MKHSKRAIAFVKVFFMGLIVGGCAGAVYVLLVLAWNGWRASFSAPYGEGLIELVLFLVAVIVAPFLVADYMRLLLKR